MFIYTLSIAAHVYLKESEFNSYNIATATQPFWCKNLSTSMTYADDGGHVVADLTSEGCQEKAELVCDRMALWYDKVGLTMNAKKTEVMCFGFDRDFRGITVKDVLIKPSTTIKFLGVKIDCDLGSKSQAKHVADKVRYAAANIRKQSTGTNLKERVILYNGWIKGVVMSNGLAYLPCLNNDQLIEIQTAMNAGIRAVLRKPKYGHIPITSYREKLGMESVEAIRDKIVAFEAWKQRETFLERQSTEGIKTRARKNLKLAAPDQRGWLGKKVATKIVQAWNSIPIDIKLEENYKKAKCSIKRLF